MAGELPPDVFEAWRKSGRALDPVAIVATVSPDGSPHTAPFGSVRALTPQTLRFLCWRGHDTYSHLIRDSRVGVVLLAPPAAAVSVSGRAAVVRERMRSDEQYAIIESCSPGPRIELFARGTRKGWTTWGNQAEEYEPTWATYAHNSAQRTPPLAAAE